MILKTCLSGHAFFLLDIVKSWVQLDIHNTVYLSKDKF